MPVRVVARRRVSDASAGRTTMAAETVGVVDLLPSPLLETVTNGDAQRTRPGEGGTEPEPEPADQQNDGESDDEPNDQASATCLSGGQLRDGHRGNVAREERPLMLIRVAGEMRLLGVASMLAIFGLVRGPRTGFSTRSPRHQDRDGRQACARLRPRASRWSGPDTAG